MLWKEILEETISHLAEPYILIFSITTLIFKLFYNESQTVDNHYDHCSETVVFFSIITSFFFYNNKNTFPNIKWTLLSVNPLIGIFLESSHATTMTEADAWRFRQTELFQQILRHLDLTSWTPSSLQSRVSASIIVPRRFCYDQNCIRQYYEKEKDNEKERRR